MMLAHPIFEVRVPVFALDARGWQEIVHDAIDARCFRGCRNRGRFRRATARHEAHEDCDSAAPANLAHGPTRTPQTGPSCVSRPASRPERSAWRPGARWRACTIARARVPTAPAAAPGRALRASQLAKAKHVVEAPLLRAVSLDVVNDTTQNLALHRRIHDEFAAGTQWNGLPGFVEWIYAELFEMPLDDAALGLDAPDPFPVTPAALALA
jgi:hypothetical protein